MLVVLSVAACGDGGTSLAPVTRAPADLIGDRNDIYGSVAPGKVRVCAFYWDAEPGIQPTAHFLATAPAGGAVLAGRFSITGPPHCIEVWNATSAANVTVSASLAAAAPGYYVSTVWRAVGVGNVETSGEWIINPDTGTAPRVTSASVNVNPELGGAIFFGFRLGKQSCSSTIWRTKGYFLHWPEAYPRATQFSAVFADAFPGLNMLQALRLEGTTLANLGRVAVAALLNASSPEINAFPLTPEQVIAEFNAAFNSGRETRMRVQMRRFNDMNALPCPFRQLAPIS